MIVREGIDAVKKAANNSSGTAICLEATTPKSRQIYEHFGFELSFNEF